MAEQKPKATGIEACKCLIESYVNDLNIWLHSAEEAGVDVWFDIEILEYTDKKKKPNRTITKVKNLEFKNRK